MPLIPGNEAPCDASPSHPFTTCTHGRVGDVKSAASGSHQTHTVPTRDRRFDEGTRAGQRILITVGDELRERRLALGLSQWVVGDAVRKSRSTVSRIEGGRSRAVSIVDVARLARVLGLDPFMRLYPGGAPIRDAAQATRLRGLLERVRPPLTWSTDVPLPQRDEGPPERRAWDAVLYGHGERTTIELESRIRDAQEMSRRFGLKRRDDPTEHWLLVVADTRMNREVLKEFGALFAVYPRIATSWVFAPLERGEHPPSGLVLL
jgi:transcriptional regulator with XRE-family HTH domain